MKSITQRLLSTLGLITLTACLGGALNDKDTETEAANQSTECAEAIQEAYDDCVANGGTEAECRERADGIDCEPAAQSDACDQLVENAYEECIDNGGSEEDCP